MRSRLLAVVLMFLALSGTVQANNLHLISQGEQRFVAYLTGYSYWSNTPAGSAAISHSVIHRQAGGRGTYEDPITLAVGHSIRNRVQTLDFPAGTMFYIKRLRRYAIVEDTCGNGPRPQNGPCHTGHRGHPWLDIYVGGRSAGRARTDSCLRRITGLQEIIINPRPGYPVRRGEIASRGCPIYVSRQAVRTRRP